jgi:cytochrome c peroxidase
MMKSLVLLLVSLGATLAVHPASPLRLPEPVTDADFHDDGAPSAAKVELGRMLFFDKLLSGNRNISCGTCHHPEQGTSDGLALGLGEGAAGLGPARRAGRTLRDGLHERIPRNSPALFNLGAREYTRMFHDGRVEVDENGYYAGGFISPARFKLPEGLDNVLAAQAMFPVTSPAEMAGQQGENEIADARARNRAAGKHGVWALLAKRLRAVPEYVRLFRAAYPAEVRDAADITFVRAANAIAAFEAVAFRADDSPFDRHLRGQEPLEGDAAAGMALFYGDAGCATCHSGPFQTDHGFHAVAMPQIGPGKNDGRDPAYWNETGISGYLEDLGRGRVTARPDDAYRFRTPSLRNVELTGPWGHAGAYDSLFDVVRHHADPVAALEAYRLEDGRLPQIDAVVELSASGDAFRPEWMSATRLRGFLRRDGFVQENDTLRGRIAAANSLSPSALSERRLKELVAFLTSLTDERSRDLRALIPERVPSGLPVED